jgi:hypothetical protein
LCGCNYQGEYPGNSNYHVTRFEEDKMPSAEINRLLMKAVTDTDFRAKFLEDPTTTAQGEGVSADGVKELSTLNMQRIREQFVHLSRVSTDLLGSVVSAGHSNDHVDRSNIHDNDGHIHDKAADSFGTRIEQVVNPADLKLNPAALADALKDPAILREFETNPALKAALKAAVG